MSGLLIDDASQVKIRIYCTHKTVNSVTVRLNILDYNFLLIKN